MELETITALKNQDSAFHLNCLKQKVLAYMSAVEAPYPLLFHSALESSMTIHNLSYIQRKFRWEVNTSYLEESDWFSLGFYAERPKVEFDIHNFIEMAKVELQLQHPVFFYAPGNDIPFFAELKQKDDTTPENYATEHSFMICGISDANIMRFYEVYNGEGLYESDIAALIQHYEKHPSKWFSDAFSLYRVENKCEQSALHEKHKEFVECHSDDFELYEFIASNLYEEFHQPCPTHELPSVNACALLYGSRSFFLKYLEYVQAEKKLVLQYQAIVAAIQALQVKIFQMFSRKNVKEVSKVREKLLVLQGLEVEALFNLKSGLGQ